MQSCAACAHSNAPHRGYCAACGHMMRLVCRGCRFTNDHGDRFCGGCGFPLLAVTRASAGAKSPAANATSAELDALFATKPSPFDDILPATGVSQDDLDRLFGQRGAR